MTSGTDLDSVLKAHREWPVLPGLFLTTALPITLASVSCRISRACARRLPLCV